MLLQLACKQHPPLGCVSRPYGGSLARLGQESWRSSHRHRETWRRAFAKCLLKVAGPEAKEACGTDQLCAGLESGIEGGIHTVQLMWDTHHMEEDWGFLLIDARNAFNEMNRTLMLWVVRHEWPSGARFTFNCYRHWSTLLIRRNNGTGVYLHSQEGVTQGDPLAMVAYGLGILPLIRYLKQKFPTVEQLWYADDAGAGGTFAAIRRQFLHLQEAGPIFGYFPEPSKSILVVPEHSLETAQLAFADLAFQVTTGHRYLGGFIGEPTARDEWLKGKLKYWAHAVDALASVAPAYPQAAYTGLQKSLQQEWQFVQRVVSAIGPQFSTVADEISSKFLPALFGASLKDSDPRLQLARLPVKQAGLALPSPVDTAESNYRDSTCAVSHLLAALRGRQDFRSAYHLEVIATVKAAVLKRRTELHEATLAAVVAKIRCGGTRRTILRGKLTGQWLSVVPSTVNGTELSAEEFRDSLLLRYALTPSNLPAQCDGCGQSFSVRHALECKTGGLVISRHNEIRDELCDLAGRALFPSAVRDEPKIYPSHPAEPETTSASPAEPAVTRNLRRNASNTEDRGDVLIRGLWARGTDCIIDVRITDTDAASNRSKDPLKVLANHEREKKRKYLQPCLHQRRHFTPFVVSTDGLIGSEGKALLQKLSALMADKTGKSYAEVSGFINARMSIAIVRATHLCLRGSRIPTSRMSLRRPQWDDGAGLSLFRH